MANQEHLDILKQGVAAWNAWRKANPDIRPDLYRADLNEADLRGADLREVDISRANLSTADLSTADLSTANLHASALIRANLSGALLDAANLSGALLDAANFSGAVLTRANLSGALIDEANFHKALIGFTTFGATYLSAARGLETIRHEFPSSIGIDTLYLSKGKIPEAFLRGCGVPDSFIDSIPHLFDILEPVQFYSCFISYSTRDEEFARRLHERMRAEHLRVWFAPEDIQGGRKLHEQIDQAIRIYDKLILILSEHSIKSEWVQQELRRARRAELETQQRKLFPIGLIDYSALQSWECIDSRSGTDLAEEVRQYFIPDFTHWKEHDTFEREFARLLRDLKATGAPPARDGDTTA